jgi:large repetitive protein
VPIGLRAKASLAVATTPPDPNGNVATGVAISLEVDFPAPIILGDSGLGIYGFIALFAMHYARTIDDPMKWYTSAPVDGDPTQIAGWKPEYGNWDFGAGAILGTMDGGFVMNLKGVLVLELPGPRLLLFMNANILYPDLPELLGDQTGPILATLDLDFGRKTLSIGLQVNYNLSPLYEISIPADAFFDFTDPSNFSLDLGTIKNPATVSVIDQYIGSGYLEIRGNGIPDFPLHPLDGFSIALGLDVALIWGDTTTNLYLEVGASAAVGIGFSPFFLAGQLTISGQLHLFVTSISASGSLTILSDGTQANTSISGQICGSVSFFFFSVSGCVGFTLGPSTVTVEPPDLVRQLYLQSRSPALVQGTGVDRPIDANLGDASDDPTKAPTVPIDSIPVLKFAFTPQLDTSFTTFTKHPGNAPGLPPDGWNKRGENFYRYTIQSITIHGPALLNSASGVPSTWRLNAPPGGDDRAIDLALMDWTPCATPRAVVSSTALDNQVTHIWGTVCDQSAPPAPVFWDFEQAKIGVSSTGWALVGTAWPDPPGTVRSAPPPLKLTVTELWRTGVAVVDSMAAVEPAYVLAWPVPCIPEQLTAPPPSQLISDDHPEISSAKVQTALHRVEPALRDFSRFVPAHRAPQVSTTLREVLGITTQPDDALSSLKMVAALRPETPALVGPAAASAVDAARRSSSEHEQCEGRVLVAPFAGHSLQFSQQFGRIPQARSPLAQANPDLTNALMFSGVPMTRVRLYLWVETELVRYGSLTLRALDADDNRLGDQVIRQRLVTAPTGLPPEWIQPGGPWTNDALLGWELLYVFGELRQQLDHGLALLADLTLPAGTASFILGVNTHGAAEGGLTDVPVPPAYMVAAVEGWSTAEEQRWSYDQTTQSQQLSSLQGALSGDPSTLPLFTPGQQYSITVDYTAESAPDDGSGHADTSKASAPAGASQTLHFNTDANFQIDDPATGQPPKPATLDPWVLCVWPGDDEAHHFYTEPITVVFSTDAIEQLVGAYGLTLQGNARAGTFQPPPSDPNAAKTKAPVFPLTPVKGNVVTPWQEAVNAAADQGVIPCVAGSGSTTTYGKQVFNLLLNPITPYTFDIETNPPPALQTVTTYTPGTPLAAPVVPMYRTAFETSRYGALIDLITDVAGARITYRHLISGASAQLAALSTTPTDAAMQSALNAAGLGVLPLATRPTITVFWQDGASSPVPVGVLLDMPEPLQRTRQTPTPVYDPNPLHDPSRVNRIIEWQMQPQIWLDLIETSAGLAQTIAVPTNGCRIYVSLSANARGKTLGLAVRRYQTTPIDATDGHTDCPLLTIDLLQAPWES